jgi:hypothetical protein
MENRCAVLSSLVYVNRNMSFEEVFSFPAFNACNMVLFPYKHATNSRSLFFTAVDTPVRVFYIFEQNCGGPHGKTL